MATEKIANYTAEATAEIVTAYVANPTKETVVALAEKFGKSTKSIVAKLARENVYVTAAKAAGAKTPTKAELVAGIASLVELPAEDLESLEKATAPALKALRTALAGLVGE